MSGATTASGEARSLTDLYLEFAEHGAAPMGDSELVLDEWPNRVQTTLGWDANRLHNSAPHAVGAAAVAATVTHIAAGRMGAESVATHPTFGHFARTRTFAGFLDNLNSPQRMAGQGPGLYLVANFCDPRTPLLRTSTVPKNVVSSLFTGRTVRGVEADAIRANDELYIGSSVGRLKDLCTQALHRALERDYGLQPENEDKLRIYTRWAIVHRLGRAMETNSTATTVHMGQFVAACLELESKLPPKVKLQDVLPGMVYNTYAQGRAAGVKSLPVREPSSSYTSIRPLRHRQRTVEDVQELLARNPVDATPEPLKIRAADLLGPKRIAVPDAETLDAVMERLRTSGDSCLNVMRLGRNAIQVELGNCRDATVERMQLDDRRRYIAAIMDRGQDLQRGGHRNGVYEDHPYLRPGMMQALYEDDHRLLRRAENPGENIARLAQLQAQAARGERPSLRDVMTAFSAASLGTVEERRQAFAALSPTYRRALRNNIDALIPVLTIHSLRDVPDMQKKYGYTYEEVVDLGIATTQLEGELPMQLYVPAAVAILDNPDSIFAVAPRKTGVLERIARGDAPPPDDPTGSSASLRELQHHLYLEAGARYGVKVRASRHTDSLGNSFFNHNVGSLLVACRLSEGLNGLMEQNPTVRENVLRLVGPVIAQHNPDDVQRQMPPLVYRQYMTLRSQYTQILQADQGGGRFGFRSPKK